MKNLLAGSNVPKKYKFHSSIDILRSNEAVTLLAIKTINE
jgi:hypothetical protein